MLRFQRWVRQRDIPSIVNPETIVLSSPRRCVFTFQRVIIQKPSLTLPFLIVYIGEMRFLSLSLGEGLQLFKRSYINWQIHNSLSCNTDSNYVQWLWLPIYHLERREQLGQGELTDVRNNSFNLCSRNLMFTFRIIKINMDF